MTTIKAAQRVLRKKEARGLAGTGTANERRITTATRTIKIVAHTVHVLASRRWGLDSAMGNCVPISLATEHALRHYGLDAEAVPCEVVIIGDESSPECLGSIPQGGFAGHAIVRVKIEKLDAIVDLTFGQFQDPGLGIHSNRWLIAAISAGVLDRGPADITTPDMPQQGITRVRYTLRPERGWDQGVIAKARANGQTWPDRLILSDHRIQTQVLGEQAIEFVDRFERAH